MGIRFDEATLLDLGSSEPPEEGTSVAVADEQFRILKRKKKDDC